MDLFYNVLKTLTHLALYHGSSWQLGHHLKMLVKSVHFIILPESEYQELHIVSFYT